MHKFMTSIELGGTETCILKKLDVYKRQGPGGGSYDAIIFDAHGNSSLFFLVCLVPPGSTAHIEGQAPS